MDCAREVAWWETGSYPVGEVSPVGCKLVTHGDKAPQPAAGICGVTEQKLITRRGGEEPTAQAGWEGCRIGDRPPEKVIDLPNKLDFSSICNNIRDETSRSFEEETRKRATYTLNGVWKWW